MATSAKKTKKETRKKTGKETKNQTEKVSKTWLAFLEAAKNPGKILDMRAVLK